MSQDKVLQLARRHFPGAGAFVKRSIARAQTQYFRLPVQGGVYSGPGGNGPARNAGGGDARDFRHFAGAQ